MTDRYQKIRDALAMGPTPGPWGEIQHESSRWTDIYHDSNRRCGTPIAYVPPYSVFEHDTWKESKEETMANAAHIAACDPDTIRALLEERDALREVLQVLTNWTPSADTYRRLGFNPEVPMRAHDAAKVLLKKGSKE